jgi:glycosyltransferase involved in cell wall biosynthesis
MNLLYIIPSTDPRIGGPIEGIKQFTGVLTREGHTVEVACLDKPGEPWLNELPFKAYPLGPTKLSYRYAPKLVPWLRENKDRYDHVIVNGLWQYNGFGAWRVLHKTTPRYFVFTHGMLDPYFKKAYPLKHLKKCLYWRWADYRVLRDAAGVCFTCEEERILARQSFKNYKAHELVINYGTSKPAGDPDAQRSAFLAKHPEVAGKRVLIFLSRIHPKKGCDLLIEAFADVAPRDPALHLVMAGPDKVGWQATLEETAKRLGVADRITWTGMLTGDLKWGAYRSAEAFVLPSHQENFGIVVVEAMACGVPVLISNKVNIWREIEEDGGGMIGDDTQEGTTEVLRKWVSLPEAERVEFGRRAERSFERRFDIAQAARNLVNAIQALKAA